MTQGGRLGRDGGLLFSTRAVRLFGYGLLSVVLALYLSERGLSLARVGTLFSAALLGDMVITLYLTTRADRLGRRRVLMAGALLMVGAGVVFAFTGNGLLLLVAATIGVLSPGGNEVGPFLAVEQAALSELVEEKSLTKTFAWYQLTGAGAGAAGAGCGGLLVALAQRHGYSLLEGYQLVVLAYALLGLILLVQFMLLSPSVEAPRDTSKGPKPMLTWLGLHGSHAVVLRLAGLFSLDAFAGGFAVQSLLAYWFHARWGVAPEWLGGIFLGANLLAAVSALLASRIADRFGLVNTMVFTHLPSNVLLMLVPLCPTLPLAVIVLFARFSISQMDVPTRQALVVSSVKPDERSAAAGVTAIARSLGASFSPAISGPLMASSLLLDVPIYLSGGLKIVYDLLLYRGFKGQEQRTK